MKKIKSISLFFLLSCLVIGTSSIGDFLTNFYIAKNMFGKINDAYDEANGQEVEVEGDTFGDKTSAMLDTILAKNKEISSKLDSMNKHMSKQLEGIKNMMQNIGEDSKKAALVNVFSRSVDRINYAYAKLKQFSNEKNKISPDRIDQFIKDNIDSQGSDGIEGHLETIFSVIVSPNNPDNLLSMMERIESKKYGTDSCGKSSPNVVLWEFYLTVADVELLGLATLETGYLLRELRDPTKKSKLDRDFVFQEQQRRMAEYAKNLVPPLNRLRRKFRNCEPSIGRDVLGETYIEMWGSYQKMIISEYNLYIKNDDCSKWNCPNYNGDTPQKDRCWVGTHSRTPWLSDGTPEDLSLCATSRQCRGKLTSCSDYEEVSYCMKRNSTRRYEWFGTLTLRDKKYGFHGQMGERTDCPGGQYNKRRRFDDDYHFINHYTCFYCVCTCIDNAPDSVSINTISLLPARADTANNAVVIGVRFRLLENILHVQVKEGKMGPGYAFLSKGRRWVRLPKIKEDIDMNRADPTNEKMRMNYDYTVLDQTQAINFDEIKLEYPRLITAVKLGVVYLEANGGNKPRRIRLEVESMEYDYKTGLLTPGTAEWTMYPAMNHTKLHNPFRDSPLKRMKTTTVDSTNDMYMEIDSTDDYKDASLQCRPRIGLLGSYSWSNVSCLCPRGALGGRAHRRD